MAFVRRRLLTWLVILVTGLPCAFGADEPLFLDGFDGTGQINTQANWKMLSEKARVPVRNKGTLLVTPSSDFRSQRTFSKPVSLVLEGVALAQPGAPSGDNHLGFAPTFGPDMVTFRFSRGGIYAFRKVNGKPYGAPDKAGYGTHVAPTGKGSLKLRIDWWPGELVRYYLNDKLVAEYTDHVMDKAMPVGVRDESAYFRIGSVKVTRIARPASEILEEKGKQEEEARRARAAARLAKWRALSKARVAALAARDKKLRMVIGSPCYMWGIDTVIENDLKAAGMSVFAYPRSPMLVSGRTIPEWKRLKLYNVIIFGDTVYHLVQPDPNTGKIPDRIKNQVPQLRRFLQNGGGIWFCGLGEQNWGRSSHALNYILKELGLDAEVVGEVVKDSAARDRYAWVDVMKDPLAEGVEHVLHPSGVVSGLASMGVVPITRLGPGWRVLLKGKPTAASYSFDISRKRAGTTPLSNTPGAVKSSPVLCAVRQAGKGRVVLWPTWSNFTVTGGSGCPVVDGERDGKTSNGARLMENLLCWLAEPSQGSRAIGTLKPREESAPHRINVDADLRKWATKGRRDLPRQYKGLIGAHSSLSDGRDSPAQIIAAARKAGYQFIAFTEDFARMNEAKWKQLLAACDRASNADPNFIAYPGLDFLDEAGNRGVVFGQRYWVKAEWRSKKFPDRIQWWWQFAYDADANPRRWPPRVVIRSKTNNKRPWNQGLYNFFAAYCYEGGKLVDDSFHEWRPLVGRHAYFMNVGILAVHTVRSVAEVAASARPDLYQSYVRAGNNVNGVLGMLSGCVGAMSGYFPAYISTGPRIEDFRVHAAALHGGEGTDLAYQGNDRMLLHVLVRSKTGIREVRVYDGDDLVRRFLPRGAKTFERFITFHPNECRCFTLAVTDTKGRQAHSWQSYMQLQDRVHRRCGDNYNWMTTGKRAGALGKPKLGYHLLEVTPRWRPREWPFDGERLPGPARPAYSMDSMRYTHGGVQAAQDGTIFAGHQRLIVDGKPWEGFYSVTTLDFSTVSRYGIVLTNTLTEDYLVKSPAPHTTGANSGPYPVATCPWPADLKQYVPAARPRGAPGGGSVVRYQGRVRFTKAVRTPDNTPVQVRLGFPYNRSVRAGGVLELMRPDGTSERFEVSKIAGKGGTYSGEIPQNGYLAWFGPDGPRVGGIIALSPGMRYTLSGGGGNLWLMFHTPLPSPVQPGARADWDVIFVSGPGENSNQGMQDVWKGMGVAGKATLYRVEPRLGEVTDHALFLTLKPEDYGFSGRIVKTSDRPLPIHLPVMVKGLNPRWDAAIWYRGKVRLHVSEYYRDPWGVQTWAWVSAHYREREDEIQWIPIIDGDTGYCYVDTDKQDPDVFVGHPLVCDQPDVFLGVMKAARGWCRFEVNNPTDKRLVCSVRPAKGFDLTGRWQRKLTLPPGGFKVVTVATPR